MILLLGGTSETAAIATGLAEAGLEVLVSTATDEPLEIGRHANISRRIGRLDVMGFSRLIVRKSIEAVVDATHPYAAQVRVTACKAADIKHLPYFTYIRPPLLDESTGGGQGGEIIFADTHEQAARQAFAVGRPVLLTSGSRNLQPYVDESKKTGVGLFARVLRCTEAIKACREAGLTADQIITGKGPFSVEQNREHIRKNEIGVLVTKDGGRAGGLAEKLQAAKLEKCTVVVIRRPRQDQLGAFSDVQSLIDAVTKTLI